MVPAVTNGGLRIKMRREGADITRSRVKWADGLLNGLLRKQAWPRGLQVTGPGLPMYLVRLYRVSASYK